MQIQIKHEDSWYDAELEPFFQAYFVEELGMLVFPKPKDVRIVNESPAS